MALIQCPECGREVSEHAYHCPNCGFPIEDWLEDESAFETGTKRLKVEMQMEDVDEEDSSQQVTDVNGIMVNLGKLIASNYYEVNASARMLNSVTKVGIVPAKAMIEEFLEENPAFNKAEELNRFIREQAELTQLFRCDDKIANLQIDHSHLLFRIGFWSYIYHFSDIESIRIEAGHKSRVSVIMETRYENTPTIQINLPRWRNIARYVDPRNLKKITRIRRISPSKLVRDFNPRFLRISYEDSMRAALALKESLEDLQAEGLRLLDEVGEDHLMDAIRSKTPLPDDDPETTVSSPEPDAAHSVTGSSSETGPSDRESADTAPSPESSEDRSGH